LVISEENFILLLLLAGAEDAEVYDSEVLLTLILSQARWNTELHSPKLSKLFDSGKTFGGDEEHVVDAMSAGIRMSM
jgi:hypothetical protein